MSPARRQDSRFSVDAKRSGAHRLLAVLAVFAGPLALAQPAPTAAPPASRRRASRGGAAAGSAGERRRPGSSCAAPTTCRRRRAATPRASCRSSCARARCAAAPTSMPSAEGDVEFRRGAMVIHADHLSYDQAEDLARATGQVVDQPRRQRLQRSRAAAQGRALRGLLSHADLSLRAHRRRRQGQHHRVHRRPARGRPRRHLLELHRRGRPGSGLDPAGARAAHRQRDQRRRRPRRRAALLRRADPGRAGVQLSAQRGAQVGLVADRASASTTAAASRWRCPTTGTSPRTATRPSRCRRACAAARRSTANSATSSRAISARVDAQADAARQGSGSFALFAARRSRRDLPFGGYVQLRVMRVSDDDYWKDFPGDVKSLTPRLLQNDLLRDATVRRLVDLRARAALAGAADDRSDDADRSSPYEREPQIGARYAALWRGGFDARLRDRVQPLRRIPTTTTSSTRRPACGCTPSAASAGRSIRRAGR